MNIDAIKAAMCEIPQFDTLETAELDTMANLIDYRKVPAGTMLVKEGSVGDSLYYIVTGKVEIKKEAVSGQQTVLAQFSKGSTVGEMSLVEKRSTRSATAMTLEDSELLVLTRENFDRLGDSNPKIALKIVRNIAGQISARLRYTSGRFADIFS